MSEPFPVITVEGSEAEQIEQLGTKPKFWYQDQQFGRCLFKEIRGDTGESWAEKAAAEIGGTAWPFPMQSTNWPQCDGRLGVISISFKPRAVDSTGRLIRDSEIIFGNEILLASFGEDLSPAKQEPKTLLPRFGPHIAADHFKVLALTEET